MNDEIQTSTGAYALNALGEGERARVELAAAGSEQLSAEITELMDTAVELGLSVAPVDPPASLRAGVLAAVARTPQRDRGDEVHDGAMRLEKPPSPAELRARSRWSTPLARLGAVAAAVALIVGLGFTVRAGLQAQSDMATATQINQIQAAGDYRRAVVEVDGGGTATVVWSLALERSALIVDGLKGLPAGSTYELWYIDGAGATPAGTFDVGDDGRHSIVLAGDLDAGDTIGVTVEPAGGSPTPSTDPIIVVPTA